MKETWNVILTAMQAIRNSEITDQRQKFIAVETAKFRGTAISHNVKFRRRKSKFCGNLTVDI